MPRTRKTRKTLKGRNPLTRPPSRSRTYQRSAAPTQLKMLLAEGDEFIPAYRPTSNLSAIRRMGVAISKNQSESNPHTGITDEYDDQGRFKNLLGDVIYRNPERITSGGPRTTAEYPGEGAGYVTHHATRRPHGPGLDSNRGLSGEQVLGRGSGTLAGREHELRNPRKSGSGRNPHQEGSAAGQCPACGVRVVVGRSQTSGYCGACNSPLVVA